MDLFVKFWGTRGSIPTPGEHTSRYGGNTACVEIRQEDTLIICDAGSGIRELGDELMTRSGQPITGHLLFSHCHWDHIQGFPFFAPAYRSENRFLIHGRGPGDDRFYRFVSGQMASDYFPISFKALRADIRSSDLTATHCFLGKVQVSHLPLEHPGGCLGYSFRVGSIKVVYMTDVELPFSGPSGSLEMRACPSDMISFVEGANLLIADGQYTDEEYLERRGWGHSSCFSTVDLAVSGRVKHLAIFHHDPTRSDYDVDDLVDACRSRAMRHGSSLIVTGAREGVELRYTASEVSESAAVSQEWSEQPCDIPDGLMGA